MPKLREALFGKGDKIKSAKLVNPEQEQLMSLIKQGLETGEGPLADIFGKFNKQEFEEGVSKPAIKQFQDEILPLINEKFIAGNQVGGSGMRREQMKGATDLQSRLAQLMYGAQQNQQQNRLKGLETSLGVKTKENIYKQGSEGLVQGAVKGFAHGAGQGVGAAVAG